MLLIFTHETPKFLLQKRRRRAAERGLNLKNKILSKQISILALIWFRRETNIEVVRAEMQEMEADFHNIETNATRV